MSQNLEAHQQELYAIQFRLARLLDDLRKAPLSPSNSVGPSRRTHQVQLLGTLLRSAQSLISSVEEGGRRRRADQNADAALTSVLSTSRRQSLSLGGSSTNDAEDYYRQHLKGVYTALKGDVRQATVWLQAELKEVKCPLPVSCVGSASTVLQHRLAPSSSSESPALLTSSILILEASAAKLLLPAPDMEVVTTCQGGHSSNSASASSRRSEGSTAAQHSTQAKEEETTLLTAHATLSAEEAVVNDIQQAITHMKTDALRMGEVMRQEQNALRQSEALLADGVTRSTQQNRELSKLDAVSASTVPRWMRALPGMSAMWCSVLMPIWAVVRQALLMTLVIAVTGMVVMLMLTVSKPRVYKGLPKVGTDSSIHVGKISMDADGAGSSSSSGGATLQFPMDGEWGDL